MPKGKKKGSSKSSKKNEPQQNTEEESEIVIRDDEEHDNIDQEFLINDEEMVDDDPDQNAPDPFSSPVNYNTTTNALSSPVSYAGTTSRSTTGATTLTTTTTTDAIYMIPGRPRLDGDTVEVQNDGKLEKLIWGTNINVDESCKRIREFLKTFQDPKTGNLFYHSVLRQIKNTQIFNMNLNGEYVWHFDVSMYSQLLNFPGEMIPMFEAEVSKWYLEEFHRANGANEDDEEDEEPPRIQVRPFNLREVRPMRDLEPNDIDKLVSIRGMIIRASGIIPDLQEAYFSCLMCQNSISIPAVNGVVEQPKKCSSCNGVNSMSRVHNRCTFSDKQWVKLQETPDAIPEGETPHTVSLYCYDDLVDVSRPGDRVEVTGVYKAVPVRNTSAMRTVRSVYRTYIDVIHIKKTEKNRLVSEDANAARSSEYFTTFNELDSTSNSMQAVSQKLRDLAKSPDIYEKLTRSLAPSIWELDDIKKGILCQLFGGTNKEFTEAGIGRFRGEINVLLVGDPGTSKSQLLQYVHKIAPRGIYTSGKGSSAVGLTAYVARDPETREAVLESGALVLSDRGVCCIDEFDKMSDQTRSILHEVMEQQTVSIAKAGIICTLNARTSILASANPRESRYNPRLSVVENIQLPPTLLSRFDLIYLVLDKPDERTDRKLASHLVALYYSEPVEKRADYYIDTETLTQYISYAKQFIHPKLSNEAATDLVNGYVQMRKLGESKKTITATPRQLESLVRISEAHARMRFSEVVERMDVAEALRLVRSAMQQAAIDPQTGMIDMDLIATGRSANSRTRMADLLREIRNVLSQRAGSSLTLDQLLRKMSEQSDVEISGVEVREALKQLESEDFLTMSGEDRNPVIRVA